MFKKVCVPVVLYMSFILSGCATFTAPKSYDPSRNAGEGLVLVSFDQSYKVVKWMYRDLNSEKGIRGFNENFISTTDQINDLIYLGNRIVYPFKLKPGRYEFFRWTLPEFGRYYASTNDFSIEFEVLPGVVTYIGNIVMYTKGEKYQLGVRDEYQTDFPVFHREYINVSKNEIVKKIAKFNGFVSK